MNNEIIDIEPSDDELWIPESGFYFPKTTLTSSSIEVDYNRLRYLLYRYPRQAFELACADGSIDMVTGELYPTREADIIQDFIELKILEVVDVVSEQGHSVMSFPYFMNLLVPLLSGSPVVDLTGRSWEWDAVDENTLQNRRETSIFKDIKTDTAFWIYGNLYSEDGIEWQVNGASSWIPVEFPCTVKDLETKYIIVDPSTVCEPIEE